MQIIVKGKNLELTPLMRTQAEREEPRRSPVPQPVALLRSPGDPRLRLSAYRGKPAISKPGWIFT